jgi:hypothetical protein
MLCSDVITNVLSDLVFLVLITALFWAVRLLSGYKRLARARSFFGFQDRAEIDVYVSGFRHPGVKTRRVVNALEYEAAVELTDAVKHVAGAGPVRAFADYLAGVIGLDPKYPEPRIKVSPLQAVQDPPRSVGLILIGGPVANQVTRYYLRDSPKYRFNEDLRVYEKRHNDTYQPIGDSTDTAIIERMVVGNQVVIVAHGFGEEQTARAVGHLVHHWERLQKQHGTGEFAIRV